MLQIVANLKLRLAGLCCNDSISSPSGHSLLIFGRVKRGTTIENRYRHRYIGLLLLTL